MILLDAPASGQCGAAPLDGGGIGLNAAHPIKVEVHPRIARLMDLRQMRNRLGRFGVRGGGLCGGHRGILLSASNLTGLYSKGKNLTSWSNGLNNAFLVFLTIATRRYIELRPKQAMKVAHVGKSERLGNFG